MCQPRRGTWCLPRCTFRSKWVFAFKSVSGGRRFWRRSQWITSFICTCVSILQRSWHGTKMWNLVQSIRFILQRTDMSVPQLKQARISGGLKGSVWTESVGTPVLLTAVMYYMRRGGWSITGVLLIQSKRICFGWHGVIAPCIGFDW